MSLLCQLQRAGGAVAVDCDHALRTAWSAGGDGGLRIGLEEVPDAAGEVALEAADGFAAGFAFGLTASEVGSALGVQAALGDREAVQGAVDLTVAAVIEAVALRSPRGGR